MIDKERFLRLFALIGSSNDNEALVAARKCKAMLDDSGGGSAVLFSGVRLSSVNQYEKKTCKVSPPKKTKYLDFFSFFEDHNEWLTHDERSYLNQAVAMFNKAGRLHENDDVRMVRIYKEVWYRSHRDPEF